MSNFVGSLLSIVYIFLVFLKFLLISILYKLDNTYIFPLGKAYVMHRLELSIMFATLGQLAAAILVFCSHTPSFSWQFFSLF